MAIKIITDSTSDFSLEDAQKLDIEIVPLKVNFGSDEYIDKFTISNEQFYKRLGSSDVLPTTTLVNPEQFIESFNKYPHDEIVGIFLSPKLSGTFQSAAMAKEAVDRENIYLVDSTSTTIGLSLLVKEAIRLKGNGLSAQAIFEAVSSSAKAVRVFAVIDTLKYLVKGGRLSAVSGAIGGALHFKPLICLSDGKVINLAKARGLNTAMAKLIEMIDSQCAPDYSKTIHFAHSCDEKALSDFIVLFEKTHKLSDYESYTIGSVVGTHAGPGAVAIAFFEKTNQ